MLDFQSIKQSFPIQDAISLLGLTVKQYNGSYRGRCPGCNGGNDRSLVITPDKKSYYCFVAQRGGDVIALVSHILKIGMREAAQKIADCTSTVPQEPAPQSAPAAKESDNATASNVLTPLTYLVADHEQVQALGIDSDTAEAIGCGWSTKGMMRQRVAFPIRSRDGTLLGYLGIAQGADIKIPANLTEKIKAL